jgi:predicted Rossmann fold flavoprotein
VPTNAQRPTTNDQLVIIGAGAAGLCAAISAAEAGARVILLEKNPHAGIKILMSGGTRCNITQNTDNRGIIRAYGEQGKFLHSALAALSVEDSIALFENEGVATKVEETNKIFPVSNRASDVVDALVRRLKRTSAELRLKSPVTAIARDDSGFVITTPNKTLRAARLIITSGGKSYPGSGTRGEGYHWAAALGHTIVPTRPALVPLTTNTDWVKDLRGITLADVVVTIMDSDKPLAARRSSLLFAHFGMTGPAALDVSRAVSGHPKKSSLVAELDLFPDQKEAHFEERLREQSAAFGRATLLSWLVEGIPRRIAELILEQAGVPADRKLAELSKDERRRVVRLGKHWPLPLTGTLGFEKAEVTAGGVALDEVDSRTIQSKLVPGLYFAGEVLDLDGPIGGYNFQAAWSTGWLAGQSAARTLTGAGSTG